MPLNQTIQWWSLIFHENVVLRHDSRTIFFTKLLFQYKHNTTQHNVSSRDSLVKPWDTNRTLLLMTCRAPKKSSKKSYFGKKVFYPAIVMFINTNNNETK